MDQVLASDWVVQENQAIDLSYANQIINTYDEQGLETMLCIQDENPTCTSIAMTLGTKETESMLKKALALQVKKAIRIEGETGIGQSPQETARLLYAGIQAIKEVDLVICGRQASGSDHGQTGLILAELLGWPCLSLATEVVRKDDRWLVIHQVEEGLEEVILEGPLVVTMTQSANHFLRMATLRDMLAAKKKTITEWQFSDAEESKSMAASGLSLSRIFTRDQSKNCEWVEDSERFADILMEELQGVSESEGAGL